jgi:microcystin-dependent protein
VILGENHDNRHKLRNRSASPLQNSGGLEEVKLAPENLPPHKHKGKTTGTSGTAFLQANQAPSGLGLNYAYNSERTTPTVGHEHSIETDGGEGLQGKPVEIMPPYIVLYYCQND